MHTHWDKQVDNIDLLLIKQSRIKNNRVEWNVRHFCNGDVKYREFEHKFAQMYESLSLYGSLDEERDRVGTGECNSKRDSETLKTQKQIKTWNSFATTSSVTPSSETPSKCYLGWQSLAGESFHLHRNIEVRLKRCIIASKLFKAFLRLVLFSWDIAAALKMPQHIILNDQTEILFNTFELRTKP